MKSIIFVISGSQIWLCRHILHLRVRFRTIWDSWREWSNTEGAKLDWIRSTYIRIFPDLQITLGRQFNFILAAYDSLPRWLKNVITFFAHAISVLIIGLSIFVSMDLEVEIRDFFLFQIQIFRLLLTALAPPISEENSHLFGWNQEIRIWLFVAKRIICQNHIADSGRLISRLLLPIYFSASLF